MRLLVYTSILLLFCTSLKAQDNCSAAITLCANSTTSRTTVGATASGTDPALGCGDGVVNNSIWFTVTSHNTGTCTITVTNIDNNPGLAMEIYTGSCGALLTTGFCTTGSSATAGTMSITFPTTSGTQYYIMVDGESGNQEPFNIVANTPNDAIISRPDANFSSNPSNGCAPLDVYLQNTTVLHGGTNISYDWKIDAGAYTRSSGLDTTVTFSSLGTHSVTLRVCNTECGCKSVSQDIVVQDLFPTISFNPTSSCPGTEIFFNGSAVILPDPPIVDPSVIDWTWDFGDPNSGVGNSASGQNVSHIFTTTSSSYNVTLIANGVCGPDTITTTVNLLPKPFVDAGATINICEGSDALLSATATSTSPITSIDWSGPGSFSCTSCYTPIVSGLPAGGPYTMFVTATDSLGCTADTTMDVYVNELPIVFAGFDQQVCAYDSSQIFTTPLAGSAPFTYSWTPSTGLSDSTSDSPLVYNTNQTYCVVMTDAFLCQSDPSCITISHYPPPTISSGSINLCASGSSLQNIFTVTGASPGSTYEWGLSPDYSLISAAAADSSDITANFPSGIIATYNFTCIINDAGTGCIDTVSVSFDVVNGLTLSVTGPSQICIGDSATLVVSGASSYSWSASPAYSFTDSTLDTQVVSPSFTTVFTIVGVNGSCTATINYNLTVNPPPTVSVAPISPVCGCSTITLDGIGSSSGMIYTWTNTGSSTIANPTSIITTANICSNDTFTLRVRDSGSLCFSDSTIAVTVLLKPAAQATVAPNLICAGVMTNIFLDGTGSDSNIGTTYLWTSDNGSVIINNSNLLMADANVNGQTVFYITVTDGFGCDSTASDTVFIQTPPVINATNPFLCMADPIRQSLITISGASSGSTYNWTTVPVCTTPNTASGSAQNFDFASCLSGPYSFDVTVIDSVTSCVYNLSQTVTLIDSVVLTVTPDTSFCEGGIANLYTSGANTYSWTNGAITDTTSISGLTTSPFPYPFTVTGTVGSCTASATVNVTVNPVPVTFPMNIPAQICLNDTSTYITISPSGGTYTWSVTGGSIISGQGTDSIRVQWTASGLASVSVFNINSFGCAGITQTSNIIVNPVPLAPIISGPTSVCENSTRTFFVNPNAGSLYYWSVTNGNYALGQLGTVNSFVFGPAGPATVSAYEVSAAGCFGPTATLNINVDPKPSVPTVTGNTLICDNVSETYQLTTPVNPSSTYTWTAVSAGSAIVNPTNDTLTVLWGSSGSGTVSVFETNNFGCNSDTTVYSITINQHPIGTIVPDSSAICNNTSFQLIGTATIGTIRWFTDGAGAFDDTLSLTPIYTPSAIDTGYIHLSMVLSNSPCANDTSRMALYVSPAPILVSAATQSTICYASSDTLNASGGSTYLWGPNGETDSTIIVAPLVTTTYTISTSNVYGCTSNDSVIVTVVPPGIPVAGADQVLCLGDTIILNGTLQNAGGVVWTTGGDGTFIPANNVPDVSYLPGTTDTTGGSVPIYLTTTGACYNLQDTLYLTINHPTLLEAGRDTLLASVSGGTVILHPTVTNANNIVWTTTGSGTFSPSDTSVNAIYTPSASDYTKDSVVLTITTAGGCGPVIDRVVVEFTPFIVPNVFTPYPGSPGLNDYFVIANLPANTKLFVYDRWGLMVYQSDYYHNEWDAYGLKSDVYYYVIATPDKSYHGAIQVIREEGN